MDRVDVAVCESGGRNLRIVPVMVFVEPRCYQCFKLVEALKRKGFECNVMDVHSVSSRRFLALYDDARSSSQLCTNRFMHPELDLSDSSYDDIDWDKVPLPFYHPVLLTPEGFYVHDDLFLDCGCKVPQVNEELLDKIMISLVRIWN